MFAISAKVKVAGKDMSIGQVLMMDEVDMVCHCGHNKTDHENARDAGRNAGRCTKGCNCSHYSNKSIETKFGFILQKPRSGQHRV